MDPVAHTTEDLFEDLSKRIKNLASKMDIILFNVKTKTKADLEAIVQDVVVLQCFHMAAYGQPNALLERFMASLTDEKREASKEDKKKRKDTGSYFTPPPIAEYITRCTLGPTIDKIKKDKRIKDKVRKILTHRVCDPCVGGGIFLVCAHDYLMTEILSIDPNANLEELSGLVATKCLFGVDINPEAIEGCKLSLHLNIAKWRLKKRIEEFVSIAKQSSSSPNDKCDSSEKPSSAQEPAQESTSTRKTTRTSGKKKSAKPAKRNSSSRTGTAPNDSAQSSAHRPVGSDARADTSPRKEKR